MEIDCFPFMGQDAQYGICAHAAIWLVAHYHHLVNRTRRVFVVWRHSVFPLSNWVRVTELQDRAAAENGRRCVVGGVVIDATSDHYDPNFLVGNLPGYWLGWRTTAPEWHSVAGEPDLYESGAALHA